MTVIEQANQTWTGLSTDTKPTTAVAGGRFYTTDTAAVYLYNGTSWVQVGGGGGSTTTFVGPQAIMYNNSGTYTGLMNFTGTTYTSANADVVLQDIINNLSTGSSVNSQGYSTGGTYGEIYVLPGIYNIHSAVILKPNISITGAGAWATIFQWPNSTIPASTSGIMFKGANWDTQSTSTTPSVLANDSGIGIRNLQLWGNHSNNTIAATGTQTTTMISNVETAGTNGVAGSESWGHGIALYCTDAWIENCLIHEFPGAGVILQYQPKSDQVIYDGTFGSLGGYDTAHGFFTTNNIIKTNSWLNGRQGFCIRSQTNIDRCWTFSNGEAGIDFQCVGASGGSYFGGGGTISNSLGFLDGTNHGGATPQTSTTYDPQGFEWRVTSPLGQGNPIWLVNDWIEAPYGPGDNLALGVTNVPASPTGWQISNGQGLVQARNLFLDNVRWSGIYIPFIVGNELAQTTAIQANIDGLQGTAAPGNPQTAVTVDGASYCNLDITATNFNGASGSPQALVLGNSSNPSWGNRIRLTTQNPSVILNWVNSGNAYNYLEVMCGVSLSNTPTAFLGGTASNVSYTENSVDIRVPFAIGGVNGSGTASILTRNGGTATFSGTGSQTVFNIAHNMVATPLIFNVSPGSTAAIGQSGTSSSQGYTVTATSTNIVVTFAHAPASGTNNVVLQWHARMSP